MDGLTLKRFPVLGAYELALKCSHVFNLLDARGAISVTERVGVMARIRTLVVGVAKAYAAQGELWRGQRLWLVERLHPTHRDKLRWMGHPGICSDLSDEMERRSGWRSFLFEIGLEEIPARMIAGAQAELAAARGEDAGAGTAGGGWGLRARALRRRGGWRFG